VKYDQDLPRAAPHRPVAGTTCAVEHSTRQAGVGCERGKACRPAALDVVPKVVGSDALLSAVVVDKFLAMSNPATVESGAVG